MTWLGRKSVAFVAFELHLWPKAQRNILNRYDPGQVTFLRLYLSVSEELSEVKPRCVLSTHFIPTWDFTLSCPTSRRPLRYIPGDIWWCKVHLTFMRCALSLSKVIHLQFPTFPRMLFDNPRECAVMCIQLLALYVSRKKKTALTVIVRTKQCNFSSWEKQTHPGLLRKKNSERFTINLSSDVFSVTPLSLLEMSHCLWLVTSENTDHCHRSSKYKNLLFIDVYFDNLYKLYLNCNYILHILNFTLCTLLVVVTVYWVVCCKWDEWVSEVISMMSRCHSSH